MDADKKIAELVYIFNGIYEMPGAAEKIAQLQELVLGLIEQLSSHPDLLKNPEQNAPIYDFTRSLLNSLEETTGITMGLAKLRLLNPMEVKARSDIFKSELNIVLAATNKVLGAEAPGFIIG